LGTNRSLMTSCKNRDFRPLPPRSQNFSFVWKCHIASNLLLPKHWTSFMNDPLSESWLSGLTQSLAIFLLLSNVNATFYMKTSSKYSNFAVNYQHMHDLLSVKKKKENTSDVCKTNPDFYLTSWSTFTKGLK